MTLAAVVSRRIGRPLLQSSSKSSSSLLLSSFGSAIIVSPRLQTATSAVVVGSHGRRLFHCTGSVGWQGSTPLTIQQSPSQSIQKTSLVSVQSTHSNQTPVDNEAFLQGSASNYVAEMYEAFLRDPQSVHVSWQAYFKNVDAGAKPGQAFSAPPALVPLHHISPSNTADVSFSPSSAVPSGEILDHLKVQLLVRAYQVRGHHLAKLDPLGIRKPDTSPPELEHSHYGFTEKDLDRVFHIGPGVLPGFQSSTVKQMTLREIIKSLQDTYCGTIGIEYSHIPDRRQCDWLRSKFEVPVRFSYTVEEKRMMLDRLIWSDSFERFVSTKWSSEKRFGLEGCESLIPGMKAFVRDHTSIGS